MVTAFQINLFDLQSDSGQEKDGKRLIEKYQYIMITFNL